MQVLTSLSWNFLPLNSYHILMLTVLLTLSVPLWCLVLILSAPYLPGQPVPLLLPLGYLSFSANIFLNSGLQKGYGAKHKIILTLIFLIDHSSRDFSANVSTAKRTYYHDKINNSPNSRMLFKTFSSLPCPPPPSTQQLTTLPHSSLIKYKPHCTIFHTTIYQTHLTSKQTRSHTSLHSLRQKSLYSSFPVILQLVRLILFHLISFKLFLLQLFLHSLTSLTHPFTLELFPQYLNRNPLLTQLF